MKLENTQTHITNLQFSGAKNLSASVSGSYTIGFVASGLYIGVPGQLVATTLDGSVVTFVSASGFIPGLFQAVSASSTAGSIVALK
jgi:hypothetical protein